MGDPSETIALARQFVEAWAPGSKVAVLRDLRGGRSGARVLLVDIAPPSGSDLRSGQYVLKVSEGVVWPDEEPESARHSIAETRNPTFSNAHIPRLVKYSTGKDPVASLYEVAGLSFSNVVTADTLDAGALTKHCRGVSLALLTDLNAEYTLETDTSAAETIKQWLGYRLARDKAPTFHRFVEAQCGRASSFAAAGRVLINPLWLASQPALAATPLSVRFSGLLHGDLHPGNLLIDRRNPDSTNFWLIDFALSSIGPLGFDHAYFELALILSMLQGAPPERLLSLAEALEADDGTPQAQRVAVQDVGLLTGLRAARAGAGDWQAEREPLRSDTFHAQFLLARIAAALNWVNKPLPEEQRRLALIYGSWMARRYAELYEPEMWGSIVAGEQRVPLENETTRETARVAWSDVWEHFLRFDSIEAHYVLVAPPLSASADLESLAFMPWSAVIDLDPRSDEIGLYSRIAVTLKQLRAVSQFGRQRLPVDFDRGTGWLMAAGWPSRSERVPAAQREWRQNYLGPIRELCADLRRTASPRRIKVLLLGNETVPAEQLQRVAETIDEALAGSGEIICLGEVRLPDESTLAAHYFASPEAFLQELRRVYGTRQHVTAPEIPGGGGWVSVPLDRLRNVEADLEVLHSQILELRNRAVAETDQFWRGNPPTWHDLHAHLDVTRDVTEALIPELARLLEASRNETLELHHAPGAGGTTVALRAAWDLRQSYPVVMLRRYTALTVDRVDQLFQLAQRPVLLLADASVLSPASREDLFRALVARNSRAVILYVVRATVAPPDRKFAVKDPMSPGEARRFYEAFANRTDNPYRKKRLEEIANPFDNRWLRYRTPFFFGLIAYERDFESIDRYVQAHIQGATYAIQRVLRYVALVTRFTQTGISEALVGQFLGLQGTNRIPLDELFGQGVARLILGHGSLLRLMHPVIAEEVLRQLLGGEGNDGWRFGLRDLSLEFIFETVRAIGDDAEETRRLFEELFIRRDFWDRGGPRRNFAEIIQAIPSPAGQHQVLQVLTETCPREAHFWNHLGRHHIYEMKQDFAQAEAYLQKAVELEPDEQVHHHSLGMVRRFWIRSILAESARKRELRPEAILSPIRGLLDAGAAAFVEARRLGPDDLHGYITHVQMILEVAERLIQTPGGRGPGLALAAKNETGDWLRQNIGTVEGLLETVRNLRGQSLPSRYELNCEKLLAEVYGDFDSLIRTWEELLVEFADASLRRALVGAYVARRRRAWGAMDLAELRRIVALTEDNLRTDPSNERDIRAWFQASRRLPEFSYLEAFDRLNAWASRSDSVDAHYYLYILHYLRWRDGVERSDDEVLLEIERCRDRARGRRGVSYEWLGLTPEWCPLVHADELGEWNKDKDFFDNGQLLDRVTGTIESIKGPQAGVIRLGERTRAFFVPGRQIWQSSNINAVVTFYLGFSYEGFRAWSVQLTEQSTHRPGVEESVPSANELAVLFTEGAIPQDNNALRLRFKSFVLDTVRAAANVGSELSLAELGARSQATFPGEAVYKRLGYKRLIDLLGSFSELEPGTIGETATVRLALPPQRLIAQTEAIESAATIEKQRPAQPPAQISAAALDNSAAVSAARSVTQPSVVALPQGVKAPTPSTVATPGGVDRGTVRKKVVEILSSEPSKRLSLPELGVRVQRAFRLEGPLARHLGTKTFAKFLETVEGVHLDRVSPTVAFASLSSGERMDVSSESPTTNADPFGPVDRSNPDVQRIVTFVNELIEEAEKSDRPLVMASLGATLGIRFGLKNTNIGSLGFKSIKELVASIPGVRFERRGSHLVVRRERSS